MRCLGPSAHCIGPYKHSPPIEVASPSDAHRLRPCRHRFMDLRLSHRPWFLQTLAFNERLQWSWVTVAVRQNASE